MKFRGIIQTIEGQIGGDGTNLIIQANTPTGDVIVQDDLRISGGLQVSDKITSNAFYLTSGNQVTSLTVKESDGTPPAYPNVDTLIFDSNSFYLNSNSQGKPMVSFRGATASTTTLTVKESDGNPPNYTNVDTLIFDSGAFYLNSNSQGKPTVSLRGTDTSSFLLLSGARAMTGDLDMGNKDVLNAATGWFRDKVRAAAFYIAPSGGELKSLTIKESDGTPPNYTNADTLIFDSTAFYLNSNSQSKPMVSLRGVAHSSLSGLANDDHTQYLLVNGTRAMTGNLQMGSHNILNANAGVFRDRVQAEAFYLETGGELITSIAVKESDGNPPTFNTKTIIFDSASFYLAPNSAGLPSVSFRGTTGSVDTSTFLLIDGTRAMTGDINMGGKDVLNAASGLFTHQVSAEAFYIRSKGDVPAKKTQLFASSTEWIFNHNLNTLLFTWSVFDSKYRAMFPYAVNADTVNQASFYFTVATAGTAVVIG